MTVNATWLFIGMCIGVILTCLVKMDDNVVYSDCIDCALNYENIDDVGRESCTKLVSEYVQRLCELETEGVNPSITECKILAYYVLNTTYPETTEND